jgi:hypothetical protein
MDPLQMLNAAASRLAQHSAVSKNETTKTVTGDAAKAIRRAVLENLDGIAAGKVRVR